jgi:hypothetical protein
VFQQVTGEGGSKCFIGERNPGNVGNQTTRVTFEGSPLDIKTDITMTMCRHI